MLSAITLLMKSAKPAADISTRILLLERAITLKVTESSFEFNSDVITKAGGIPSTIPVVIGERATVFQQFGRFILNKNYSGKQITSMVRSVYGHTPISFTVLDKNTVRAFVFTESVLKLQRRIMRFTLNRNELFDRACHAA